MASVNKKYRCPRCAGHHTLFVKAMTSMTLYLTDDGSVYNASIAPYNWDDDNVVAECSKCRTTGPLSYFEKFEGEVDN